MDVAWTIVVHEDSTARSERITVSPEVPYLSALTGLRPERVSAPVGKVVTVCGDRINVFPNAQEAEKHETDSVTRLFDDQGQRLA